MAQESANDNSQSEINKDFIATVKSSVRFDDSWNPALASIPTCLAALAKANVYAALPATAAVDMTRVIDPNVFRSSSLGACLEQVVNACMFAFDRAQTNFQGISWRADAVFDALSENVFPGLADIEMQPTQKALTKLKNAMDDLQNIARTSKEHASEVSREFDKVLAMSMELNRATIDLANMSGKMEKQAQLQAYATAAKLVEDERAVKTSQGVLDKFKTALDDANAAYKKASDDFPSTMQVMGESVAMAFTDCATSIFTQLAPVLAQNMTAAGQVQGGVQVAAKTGIDITEEVRGPKKDFNPVVYDNPNPPKTVDYAGDAGYLLAPTANIMLMQLGGLVTCGPDGGVEWDHVGRSDSSSSDSDMITYLIKRLENAAASSSLTCNPPSVELKSIINKGLAVAKAIQSAAKGGERPFATSETVKGWQNEMQVVVNRISTLCTTANAAPGTGGALGAAMKQPTPMTAADAAKSATSAAKTFLESANARLTSTQVALTNAMSSYTTASTQLSENQEKLAFVKADLITFRQNARTLAEVVAILTLVNCTILDFKTEINKLVCYFQSIAELVNTVIDERFNPFMKNLQSELDDSNSSIAKGGLGGITISDFARHSFYAAACTLAAYFDLFGDATKIYAEVSKTYINGGGLAVVGHAGATYQESPVKPDIDLDKAADITGADYDPLVQAEIPKRLAIIGEWTASATAGINSVLQAKHATATSTIEDQIKALKKKMDNDKFKNAPPPPHVIEGQKTGGNAAKKAVEARIKNTPLLASIPNVARSDGLINLGTSKVKRGA